MTPTLLSFCDISDHLRYININNIEVIKFKDVSNRINLEKMITRYKSGAVLEYEVSAKTAEILKKKLNTFVL